MKKWIRVVFIGVLLSTPILVGIKWYIPDDCYPCSPRKESGPAYEYLHNPTPIEWILNFFKREKQPAYQSVENLAPIDNSFSSEYIWPPSTEPDYEPGIFLGEPISYSEMINAINDLGFDIQKAKAYEDDKRGFTFAFPEGLIMENNKAGVPAQDEQYLFSVTLCDDVIMACLFSTSIHIEKREDVKNFDDLRSYQKELLDKWGRTGAIEQRVVFSDNSSNLNFVITTLISDNGHIENKSTIVSTWKDDLVVTLSYSDVYSFNNQNSSSTNNYAARHEDIRKLFMATFRFTGAGPIQFTNIPIDATNWPTYKHENQGYSFKYPPDWEVRHRQIATVTSSDDIISVYLKKRKYVDTTVTCCLAPRSLESLRAELQNTTIQKVSAREYNVNGNRVMILNSGSTQLPFDAHIYLVAGDRMFEFWVNQQDSAIVRPEYETVVGIIRTFELLPN